MGARGELFTTQVYLDNRSYFFNVKENRTGDVFLQVVESKSRDGEDFDRHQIAVFAEDLQKFLQGMDKSLSYIEKDRKARAKAAREKKAAKDSKYGKSGDKKVYYVKDGKPVAEEKRDDGIKRTGRVIHIVSKRTVEGGTESQAVIEQNNDAAPAEDSGAEQF
jgi:Protein of unknown function (DUF3276).